MNQNLLQRANNQVKVYVRINSSKKGIDFKCPAQIKESDLIHLLQQKIQEHKLIKKTSFAEEQALSFFIEGRQIDSKGSVSLQLRPDTIIHTVLSPNSKQSQMNITLKYFDNDQYNQTQKRIQIEKCQNVKQAIQYVIQEQFNKFLSQISLVYLGSQLSLDKTFEEQSVEKGSEILVIPKLKSGTDQSDVFQSGEQIQLNFQKVYVKSNEPIPMMGFNMPYNPKMNESKLKKLLAQNIQAHEHQVQINNQLHQAQILATQQPPRIPSLGQINPLGQSSQSQQNDEKMDEEKNIPTKEEIEEEKAEKKEMEAEEQQG